MTFSRTRVQASFLGSGLFIAVIVIGESCGISSIAPYNPDGAARPGSGGVTAGTGGATGTGGALVASGGVGQTASGGKGGTPGTGGRGGQVGVPTGGSGGPAGAGTGGRGGQAVAGTGGSSGVGVGGSRGSGGAPGTGAVSGAGGGVTPACNGGDQRCSGDIVETCLDGQWTSPHPCATRQACAATGSSARCVCKIDPLCMTLTSACVDASTIASCAQDQDGCFYQSASSMCTTGACSPGRARASCCTCGASGPQCTAGGTSQACDSGVICGRSAPTVCTDTNWAQWPMPNDRSTTSTGAPNAASYTDNGDGTVTDKVTGLMWQQATSGPYNWTEAAAHCPTLTLAGHNDWRLPAWIELLSLLDYSIVSDETKPMVNATYFPTAVSNAYWTSTPMDSTPPSQWSVDTHWSSGSLDASTSLGYTMCVR